MDTTTLLIIMWCCFFSVEVGTGEDAGTNFSDGYLPAVLSFAAASRCALAVA